MQDPYLIAEEILESIIEEGHPVEEIVNLSFEEYRIPKVGIICKINLLITGL